MGFVADVVGGVVDAVGGVVGGAVNAVEQIPIVGDVVSAGMNVVQGVTDFLGPIGTMAAAYFGGPLLGGAMQGAEGALLSAGEMQAAVDAYTAAGYSLEEAMGFVGQAAGGVSAATVGSIIEGGGTLQMAAQGAFTGAGASTMSSILSGAKTVGTMANVGSNLYQAYQGLTNTQTPGQAQTSADPYAPYRQDAAKQLNQLVSNPGSITGTAGYQAGLNSALTGTQRQLAQTGQSVSGMGGYNMALTSGDYFNTQFNSQYNKLAQLSGANQAPSVGQSANAAQQALQAKSQASSLSYLNAGIGGIQDLMKSYWG